MSLSLRIPGRLVLAALLLALVADQLFFARGAGFSAPLFVGAGLAVLLWLARVEQRPPTRANLWLSAALLIFAGCLALRASPMLVALDTLAVLGLLVLVPAHFRGPGVLRAPLIGVIIRSLGALWGIVALPPLPLRSSLGRVPLRREGASALLPVVRGLLLALPVVAVFGALLMSADSVFSSYVEQLFAFEIPFDLGLLIQHALFIAVAAWAIAGGLRVALRGYAGRDFPKDPPSTGDTQRLYLQYLPGRWLGTVEALTVLALVDLLFGTFMLVQGAYFFGGLDTLARTGMTYADYARRGFFELLAVAFLTLGLLGVLALVTRRATAGATRRFNAASGAAVVLVLGMLASAFQRMWLYEQAYGFTELRVYTHSFMLWLAVVLVLYLAALLRERWGLFVLGTAVSALLYLAALNVVSPDALIARENVARYQATGKLDAPYLSGLSADATPALVAALPTLPADDQAVLREGFAEQRARLREQWEREGWPAWSMARQRAWQVLSPLDLPEPARR